MNRTTDSRTLRSAAIALALAVVLSALFSAAAEAVQITEFPLPAGAKPWQITAGPDGNMWFTDGGNNAIGKIGMGGEVTEYSLGITPKAGLNGIATGGEGNIWFTEREAHKVGRITTSGAITEFSAGLTGSPDIYGIASGPGGMWFTETFASRIGRIETSTGAIKEFPIPAGVYTGIVSGPDGNLWATNVEKATIVRLTPAGVATSFGPLPAAECAVGAPSPCPYPSAITTGPDGNLWFNEERGNAIGKITPAGGISGFMDGLTHGAGVAGLATGAEGNIWFTEAGANQVGRITTAGQVSEFNAGISEKAAPRSIALGPDQNLWITEPGIGKIARIIPDVPPAVATGPKAGAGRTTATVTGTVRPRGSDTSFYFEYGPKSSYGHFTPAVGLGSGDATLGVSAKLFHLEPHHRYHYRLVAVNGSGPSYGQDRTFRTKRKHGGGKVSIKPFEMYVEGFVAKGRKLRLNKVVVIRVRHGEKVSFSCKKCSGSPAHGRRHAVKSKVSFGGLKLTVNRRSLLRIAVSAKNKGTRVRNYGFRISSSRAETQFKGEHCVAPGHHKAIPCHAKHHKKH